MKLFDTAEVVIDYLSVSVLRSARLGIESTIYARHP